MATPAQPDTPYDITTRLWRDEQPGDEPTLNFSAVFVPRDPVAVWQEPRLQQMEVVANGQRWTPRASALTMLGGGGFEITASGEATLAAGAKATVAVTVQTAAGPRQLTLADIEIARTN